MTAARQQHARYKSGYISVAATSDGFWRAGRQWGTQPTVLPVTDLSAEQLQQLEADSRGIIITAVPADSAPVDDDRVAEAIRSLNPKTKAHWTGDGRPTVEAIEKVLGRQITEADRDRVWGTLTQAETETRP